MFDSGIIKINHFIIGWFMFFGSLCASINWYVWLYLRIEIHIYKIWGCISMQSILILIIILLFTNGLFFIIWLFLKGSLSWLEIFGFLVLSSVTILLLDPLWLGNIEPSLLLACSRWIYGTRRLNDGTGILAIVVDLGNVFVFHLVVDKFYDY